MCKRSSTTFLLSIAVLMVAALACGGGGAPSSDAPTSPPDAPTEAAVETSTSVPVEPTATSELIEDQEPDQAAHDTVFPLPDDVQNFMGDGGEGMVNFQTGLSLDQVVQFYRQAFSSQGLTEREILTVIEDASFSMVFDGSPNGMAVVIQGVNLGEAMNVNIRFEDV